MLADPGGLQCRWGVIVFGERGIESVPRKQPACCACYIVRVVMCRRVEESHTCLRATSICDSDRPQQGLEGHHKRLECAPLYNEPPRGFERAHSGGAQAGVVTIGASPP